MAVVVVTRDQILSDAKTWYLANIKRYESLTYYLGLALRDAMIKQNVMYDYITTRTKTLSSFLGKIDAHIHDYTHNNFQELNDISGVRIIVLVPDHIDAVVDVIMRNFRKIRKDDKSKELGLDRLGYRAIHFDAQLPNSSFTRENGLENIVFEIQIHTILGYAWTQLEHDPNYKFSGSPPELQRRFHLLAGLLESAELSFIDLVKSIEQLKNRSSNQGHVDKPSGRLDGITLESFIKSKLENSHQRISFRTSDEMNDIVIELNLFGIYNLARLNKIIPSRGNIFRNTRGYVSIGGVLRLFMIRNNCNNYYSRAWNRTNPWRLTPEQVQWLKQDGVHIDKIPLEAMPQI